MTDDETFDEMTESMRSERDEDIKRHLMATRKMQMVSELSALISSYAATPSTNQFEVIHDAVDVLYGIGLHAFENLDSSLREMQFSPEERERIMDDARLDLGEGLIRAFYGSRGPNRK